MATAQMRVRWRLTRTHDGVSRILNPASLPGTPVYDSCRDKIP